RPLGVFDSCCVASIFIDGVKGSDSHPVSVSVDVGKTGASDVAPSLHDWASMLVCSGSQDVGSVRNGIGCSFFRSSHSSPVRMFDPRVRHCEPRDWSCRSSPGTPQIVTTLEM